MIKRNLMRSEFCPVLALLFWLKMTGLKSGPLFPAMTNDHLALHPNLFATPETHAEHLKKLFVYVGGDLAGCTSHSVRKAAVSWAARCGVSESDILLIGRWVAHSKCFLIYRKHGLCIAKKYIFLGQGRRDPIFEFWSFNSVMQTAE